MNLKPPGRRDGTTGTLGELLFAGKSGASVPENDWVALVQSIAAGDQLALYELYGRTHRLVFTLLMRITHDPGTAEELTLEVFHDVWRHARTYDAAGGSVLGWIMNMARSRAIDRLRYEQRKKRVSRHSDGPESYLLRNALAVLTDRERQAIETAFFAPLTYVEAAARIDQPPGTVKTQICSGLRKLRQALATGATAP